MIRATAYLLLIIFFSLVGCSPVDEESTKQQSRPSSVELTLPQVPKLSGPYKPTNQDIQIALRNSGFYKGEIDGDAGPLTKRAIREFQAKHGLTVDGKIGPKTWSVLVGYLLNQEKREMP